jgi:serine/threonine protein kinase
MIPTRNIEVPPHDDLSADAGPIDSQPTIITKSPALAAYPLSPMHPRDIGRLLEGERLGHFDLGEFVGGGGMGAVFRAHDTMLNRTVAVKVLSHEQSGDEETLRRFQNEAQSAARLDHQNISRVYYVGEDRGWHYIVFEFIEGSNLREVVAQQGPLPLPSAISYVLQVADALAHASQRDVVHRDIKPSNVLISPDGHAKLVDMGLARLHQVEPAENDLTASGVTLGTFDYISPEQARDPRSADVRSDIYSLGCTLYFMLTGRPPFPEGTVLQKLLQHQGDEPPDPRTCRSDLPDDLMRILDRMLAKSPERRYQRAEDLVADLTTFAGRHGLDAAGSGSLVWIPPSEVSPTPWERHMPWVVPVALLFVIVAVLGVVWSHEADQAGPPPLQQSIEANSNLTRERTIVPADRDGDEASGLSDAASKPMSSDTGPATTPSPR